MLSTNREEFVASVTTQHVRRVWKILLEVYPSLIKASAAIGMRLTTSEPLPAELK